MQVSPETSVHHSLQHVVINLDMYTLPYSLKVSENLECLTFPVHQWCTCTSFWLGVPHSDFDRLAGMHSVRRPKKEGKILRLDKFWSIFRVQYKFGYIFDNNFEK